MGDWRSRALTVLTLATWVGCGDSPPSPAVEPEVQATPLPAHRTFPTAAAALRHVLLTKPKVLGVGEYHATVDGPKVPSAIDRFTTELLPVVAPHMTDLVIETWVLDGACGTQEVEITIQVETELQRPPATKSEILRLAERAQALGVQPHDLKLSCADYASVHGDDGEIVYGTLLTMLTQKLEAFGAQGLALEGDKGVVLYGGAVHNDLHPRAGLESYSYGLGLSAKSPQGFVELDLYVPEMVRGQQTLMTEPWYPLVDGATSTQHVVLYKRSERSFLMLMKAGDAAYQAPKPKPNLK